ncbi:uncharacterized protein LOC119733937 [Patiria miniata]|uniref:Uncharacterized protein n=1 Tax=Patiria miniata TaxID=46514 RepID=A0A914AI60_PATMI|nr:uncharacterized protein LOC119733937 [Patiria miniata]
MTKTMDSPQVHHAADFARGLLTNVLDDLLSQVDGSSKTDRIKESLGSIREIYQKRLSCASSQYRTDWNDPANRCAYVFLYLLQHCHLVCTSLQINSEEILTAWRRKSNLKVCCIGGGPGSDLVGLTTFLRENNIFPSKLECLVLDLYPSWEDAWMSISEYIPCPDRVGVAYRPCNVVNDTLVLNDVREFIKQADMLTFVKSFSAVSAFFRKDSRRGNLLRSFLRDIKPGCFVLFIDNEHVSDGHFQQEFASRVGLELVFERRGAQTVPRGTYSQTIKKYCRLLECQPMRTCDVIIQLFRKKVPVEVLRSTIPERPSSSTAQRAKAPQHPSHQHRSQEVEAVRSTIHNRPSSSTARRSQTPPRPSHQYRSQDYSYNYREPGIPRSTSHDNEGLSWTEAGIILGVGVGALLLISLWRNR